jgi:hypothetical protein
MKSKSKSNSLAYPALGIICVLGYLLVGPLHFRGPPHGRLFLFLAAIVAGWSSSMVLRRWQTPTQSPGWIGVVGLFRLLLVFAGFVLGLAPIGSQPFQPKPSSEGFAVTAVGRSGNIFVTPLYTRCMQDCSGESWMLEVSRGKRWYDRFRNVRLSDGSYWKGQDGRTDVIVLRGSCQARKQFEGMAVLCVKE